MKFFTILASAFSLAVAVAAVPAELETRWNTAQVTWDSFYDTASNSLNNVACSNGEYGLESKGYKTFGDLPDFPYIGGAQAVAAWNSPNCGTCWQLTYQDTTITVLAVDHAGSGFNIAKEAMNKLTNGQADQLGVVQVTYEQVDASVCGL